MAQRTALLAGGTGLVGSRVLSLLLESPHYSQVTALTRRPIGKEHPRLRQLMGDADSLPDLGAPDDVFCALGTTIRKAGSQAAFRKIDYEYPLAIARRASAGGARQFLLVSSVGADARSSNFYLRTKGELEHELGALPFRSLHIFHPSFLIGERAESRTGERLGIVVAKVLGPLLVGGLRQYRAIPADAVARAMVETAVRGEIRVFVRRLGPLQEVTVIRDCCLFLFPISKTVAAWRTGPGNRRNRVRGTRGGHPSSEGRQCSRRYSRIRVSGLLSGKVVFAQLTRVLLS